MSERLQKVIANAGYCSRRKAEALIESGVVRLNRDIAQLGDKADLGDEIFVEGNRIERAEKKYYYMLNKPKGALVTKEDPQGRKTIYDLPAVKELVAKLGHKLNYVGRLDGLSEGLLVLTNDGELTNMLTHPSKHAKKTYFLRTEPTLSLVDVRKLEAGVEMDGRPLVSQVSNRKDNTFCLTIAEGRNRIIRNTFEKLKYSIFLLKRIAVENIELGNLEKGQVREIDKIEIDKLKNKLS
ncbi:rRNA pseudouridine synthase [archaeon]|jgi:23S rRNA pseudouridine2605 synthase|nr:rRNA pseudouridine synthase [archaeon]